MVDTIFCCDDQREGFLASITKNLQKRVATVGLSREEQDNMEHSMKKVFGLSVLISSHALTSKSSLNQSKKCYLLVNYAFNSNVLK